MLRGGLEGHLMKEHVAECSGPFAFGLDIARQFASQGGAPWPELFEELRRTGQLARAISEITQLLDEPEHRDLAAEAFRCIGIYLAACRRRKAAGGRLEPDTLVRMRAHARNG
jgi:hypothetical protein